MANISMDKKYKLASGEKVRILWIDAPGDLPVAGMIMGEHGPYIALWQADGKSPKACAGYYDLIERSPYEDFYRGQPVIVSNRATDYGTRRRYFSHETNGTAYCFIDGGDAWTGNETTVWAYCRALTAEEQAEYDALIPKGTAP